MSEDFRPDQNHLTLLYWLARAVDMWGREGFEEGPAAEEIRRELRRVLFNFGFPYPPDPGVQDDPVVGLLARGPAYGPAPVPIPEGFTLKQAVLDFEARHIAEALRMSDGHVSRAAPLLGMTHQRLTEILKGRHKELGGMRNPVRLRPGAWSRRRRKLEKEKNRDGEAGS